MRGVYIRWDRAFGFVVFLGEGVVLFLEGSFVG